jgi:hypothetical protein
LTLAYIEHTLRHLIVPVGEFQTTTAVIDTPESYVEY